MSRKNVLRFAIAFILCLGSLFLQRLSFGDNDLWMWVKVVWMIVWTGFAVWNILTRETRIPWILGTLAAVGISFVFPSLFGWDWIWQIFD